MTTSEQLLRSRSRPLDAGAASLIVLMCLLWGLNQVAIKFGLPDVPPFIQAVIRSTGGLLIVLGWVRLRGIVLIARDGTLLPGIAAGLLFGLEFLFIYAGAAAAVLFHERVEAWPGGTALSWLVYQVLVVGITFPFWFCLIQRFSATRVSAFTILTPLFGVAAGCLLLGEPFTLAFAMAVGLVIAGLVLVNRPR